jgi:uncharacterized protein (TIGR03435 family)
LSHADTCLSQEYNVLIGAFHLHRFLFLGAALLSAVHAQPTPPPTFEVASIKPHSADDRHIMPPQFQPGGRFTSSGLPLKFLIASAWNVGFQSVRLSGGPAWISSREGAFDIEAKAPAGAVPEGLPSNLRDQRMRLMLQALLQDRFKLKIRTEARELPVYAVVVAKNGPKLEKSKVEEKDCVETQSAGITCHTIMGGRGRGLHAPAVNLSDILSYVENWTDRPLVDQTGLQGLFNVQTSGWRDFQPGAPPPPGAKAEDGTDLADVPTLFDVFGRLGLKLQAQKETVDVFVIEHVERPSEN